MATAGNIKSPQQFRQYAINCVRVSQSISDPVDRATLLQMAKLWRDLADISEKDIALDFPEDSKSRPALD